ncbi:vacuolar ATPase assembly integral membrane protein VMA21 isoform X4 [Bubalus bubalis]|uniref:vacuolar ATPase assembly integral membrane protein VMA21 isoform X4 n=1 Tax=Bubalus bubalis TaxID=89462 RepID=UPI001D129EEF|nr:vacuolar ATPase assembly integral membrane protein VMA21 isoform X4 [Bubalus bubalis]
MERLDKAALNALQPSDFRNESSLASTLKTLLFFTALMITVPIGLYFTTKSYVFEAPGERELVDMGGGLWGNVPLLADIGRKRK